MSNNKRSQSDDPISKFMFGDKTRRNDSIDEIENENSNNSTIDYEQLFNTFDTLVESASKLKPLLSKVTPLIEKHFLKKK
ncbi:hypothetical protein [Neobacillus sp. D3-1R]|uniref:hypothetical protein n=1 Tax=Neobacillus sp. D3-1R TaxID=3445778 RepID=UPI003F9F74B6